MDKNHNKAKLGDIFTGQVNSVFCHNAFTKELVIQKIIREYKTTVVYLDFDLLHSGYVGADMAENGRDVTVFTPKRDNWNSVLKEIIARVSSNNCIVIVDSLNGFFTLFDDKDSGRYANSCMMLLASMIRGQSGKIFFSSIARLREDGWVLFPTGRHALGNKTISKFFARDPGHLEILSPENKTRKTVAI